METVAVGVPHASWLPARAAMMAEIRPVLMDGAEYYQEFTDKEHWTEWFTRMLRWAVGTDAGWFLTIQDDCLLAPSFHPILNAMMQAWPGDLINLAATHSQGPEVARQGRHSYRASKVVGWGWAAPMPMIADLLEWSQAGNLDKFSKMFPTDGEDTFTYNFLHSRGMLPRCPVPTIIDHRYVESTNVGFDDHTHRKSTVTWRSYPVADMVVPDWWRTTCSVLPADIWRQCWICQKSEACHRFDSGVEICDECTCKIAIQNFGRMI